MVRSCGSFLRSAVVSVALLAAQASAAANASSGFIAAEAPDYNNQVVGNFLANVANVRASGEAYAVFDWDNTCMYGDISYTSVTYQVETLDFRIAPEDFATVFALGYNETSSDECLVNGTNSVLGTDVNGNDVTLATVLSSTAADYKVLYDAYIGPHYNLTSGEASTLEDVKNTTEFANFRAKFGFLSYGMEAMDGGNDHLQCAMKIAMTIFPQMLVGMTETETRTLIKNSIRANLGAALDAPSYISTGDLQVEGDYTTGLRPFNGQETTMRALRANDVDVYIISASPQIYAEEAGGFFGLTYLVPNTNVFGVRFAFDSAGKFTGQLIEDYPITWGPGKATIVTSILKQLHNEKAPVYSSGDSDGDCEMLDTVRDGVVDVNNRLKGNSTCINGFYQKACTYLDTTEPVTNNAYLLQGQDKTIGSWIPSGFSTTDGISYTSAVATADACAAYKFLDV